MKAETELIHRWRAILTSYSAVACELERVLQDQHGLSLSEYEALDRLTEAEHEKCRMQQLAAEMYLSQSALSRTVARLERGGLVERTHCEFDRRGVFVKLTPEGVRRHRAARATHLAVLTDRLPATP